MQVKVNTPWMAAKAPDYPEVLNAELAFFGRSNVGKSSLLNALLNRKQLAYTSSMPGKTRTVNFYWMQGDYYITDLPGYGYAHKQKNTDRFAALFEDYLASGRMSHAFILIDGRHAVNPLDVQMAETLKYLDIPYSIVVTKRDKLNQSQTHAIETAAKEAFGVSDDELYVVSSLKGRGIERLKAAIETMIQLVKAQDN